MPRSNRDIILIAVLSCLWAIQAAVVLSMILGIGHPPALINELLLPEAVGRMVAKWDVLIYIFFIAVALITGRILIKHYARSINYWFIIFEAVITFLMVSAVFKLVIYDNSPKLAQWSLNSLIVVSALSKIFYPEMKKALSFGYQKINCINWTPFITPFWVVFIVLVIYMPDCERVIATIYMGDWLHHFDFLIMSVGWASLCGQLPYVDVIGQYGVGLPIIFAKLIHAFGGFDYVTALKVMMWSVIIYFIFTYFFVRYWLKSALIAGVAFLLVFRLQMFHYGVSPYVWCMASASPIRFGWDILWMAAIVQHIRTGQSRWLMLAAIYSGFAPYYMTSGGICLMVTFYAYLLSLIILPSIRRVILSDSKSRMWYSLCWVLPLISATAFFYGTLKGYIFQLEYWRKVVDYMIVFGHTGAIPMFESLKYRHFWAFFMSMVMPFTYLITLFYISIGLYFEKFKKEWIFTVLLCIDGLANYQYYVVRAAVTSYYVDVLPFVLISCFWFMQALEFFPLNWQRRLKCAALFLSFYALFTNQNFLAYPNLLNFSRNPMTDNLVIQRFPDRQGYFNQMYKRIKEHDKLPINDLGQSQEDVRSEDDFNNDVDLVNYFRAHFDFKEDAQLIDSLTDPGERVALVSSFETRILIEANRAPFFYHFPLLTSRPMTFRTYPSDAAHVPSYQMDTITSIEERRPKYVFMEKVFLQDNIPDSYRDTKTFVLAIVGDIKAHYFPFEQGKYLVAMKRKD